jgi:hypothetical protein
MTYLGLSQLKNYLGQLVLDAKKKHKSLVVKGHNFQDLLRYPPRCLLLGH